ncbi:MAG: formyltransferase family protein [Cryomorphaceae bacterium]
MRTFVIGSKELSCIVLDILLEQGHEVLGVFSRDDEAGMRVWHETLGHRSLAALAQQNGIPVHFGMKVNSQEARDLLDSLDLDIVFSCFWSELFKEEVLSIPRLGVFNFHTAELPKNRGSRPIPWSIIHGASRSGITLHRMATGVDNGPIADQEAVAIEPDDNAATLYIKLMFAGKRMFERVLPRFADGTVSLVEQMDVDATYQLRGEPFGGQWQWGWSAEQKERFIQAMHFPPFKAHRPPPETVHEPGVRLCVLSEEGKLLTADEEVSCATLADTEAYKTRLSGGDANQRKELRLALGPVAGNAVVLSPPIDLNAHFPIIEALTRKNASAVSSLQVPYSASLEPIFPRPFRYHNGLLEIPRVRVNAADIAFQYLQKAIESSQTINIPVYVTLQMDTAIAQETFRLLSQENLTTHLRKVGFREVCNEFDTDYEDFSA